MPTFFALSLRTIFGTAPCARTRTTLKPSNAWCAMWGKALPRGNPVSILTWWQCRYCFHAETLSQSWPGGSADISSTRKPRLNPDLVAVHVLLPRGNPVSILTWWQCRYCFHAETFLNPDLVAVQVLLPRGNPVSILTWWQCRYFFHAETPSQSWPGGSAGIASTRKPRLNPDLVGVQVLLPRGNPFSTLTWWQCRYCFHAETPSQPWPGGSAGIASTRKPRLNPDLVAVQVLLPHGNPVSILTWWQCRYFFYRVRICNIFNNFFFFFK